MNLLPIVDFSQSGDAVGRWWSTESDGRILCKLCPRACRLKPGDRGFCFVRVNRDGKMVLDTYGRSTGFCIDPIEKKPLNHFFPGTPVLSFGTAGCNLGCKFCQNWDISKSREVARLSDTASPQSIAEAAARQGCRSVAFTYNDPVIWAEYAIDTAAACRSQGIKTVAVTAAYITAEARREFFAAMDAANIDLKGFTEEFYYGTTGAHLDPILDTIRFACRETDCWVELTNLIIPDANDDGDQLQRMCDWILEAVGSDVPVHFTAFHPDFRMTDRPRTSEQTLVRAYQIAQQTGLRYVYVGNVHDVARQSTYCPSCGQLLIERDWHQLGRYRLDGNRCGNCQYEIAGHFESQPGSWGRRRQPIRIGDSDPPLPSSRSEEPAKHEAATVQNLEFSEGQRDRIHRAACQIVFAAVCRTELAEISELLGDLADRPVAGIYVTLKRGQTLRGCCGLQGPPVSLGAALVDAGTRTARDDPRMSPIAAIELEYLSVSVSILGSPRPIGVVGDDRADKVQVGKHGLRIQMGNHAGLLLPSVAKERSWSSRQFLDAVCRKAGLPPASWRSDQAAIHLFDGIDFSAPMADRLEITLGAEPRVFNSQQLSGLCRWVGNNMVAAQNGATPLFYCSEVPDGVVSAVALTIVYDPNEPPASWIQWKLRDGVPIQSTLFQLTQTAAAALVGRGAAENWQIRIAVLTAPVHHGIDSDADLVEVDCRSRAIVATDGRRCSIGFDAAASPQDLLREVLAWQPFRRDATQIYSAVCDCTDDQLAASIGPRHEPNVTARPPAVAGSFYPQDDSEREALVDQLLDELPPVETESVAAAMVPHAGLRYSGRIAADVWRRIDLPSDVLIIGPKHTPEGADWAVAPHHQWQLSSTASLPGAVELAEQIAARIPGMELDGAAHRREHGIEVQLPLLYRLAPQTRVAAIAMQGGSFEELRHAASALADWIGGLDNPPLLVISSDMNHFADDSENRRRDALALAMLEQYDPEGLLNVCEEESISMCGQIPAALVLLTLKALGQQVQFRQIAYATSGDVSGDLSRVVGYAGVLF
jgi:AmmeMemoRadiSam system radical SAM enzyme/AmmeMemoRadiSam system protein B/AmmeMemoRadiSam system protein A